MVTTTATPAWAISQFKSLPQQAQQRVIGAIYQKATGGQKSLLGYVVTEYAKNVRNVR